MQFLFAALLALLGSAAAASIEKRACGDDSATLGYAAGTTGGVGGTVTTVTTLDALTSAVSGTAKKIVYISGTITGNTVVKVGSNTSVVGKTGSSLVGVGLRVLDESNVIIRNVKISKVLADAGDAIGVQASHNVWIDHNDLSSDLDHDKDYYDGLLDITHGVYAATVTYNKLSNHYKASLVGHSDDNGSEDTAIRVTYAYNYWSNLNSRTPSFRFGTGHLFNNYYENNQDGINTRVGAQLLVENNVWSGCKNTIYSTSSGYAVARGNDCKSFPYGNATANSAPTGTFTTAPYSYTLLAATAVKATVTANAGQKLSC
ncbi:polysaccharide lyase family 1 protein [Auriculariales sp. MPI-PUGE-AT-0066]|nr:polysaccharide lyase family 1 protein [Auriculariales sp. MPI-PUGE-AT-0066]